MNSVFRRILFFSTFCSILFTGCPLDPFTEDEERLVILSYNCQNLFDDVDQGTEYPEYDPSGGDWDTDAYVGKLAALAAVVRKAPEVPDVLLLQEVENSAVLRKLCNDFLPPGRYDFAAAPPSEGAAVQTGVISRCSIIALRTHRPGGGEGERNILEVRLAVGDDELVLFNNHWKSRLGGEAETESERIRAALLLRRRISELASLEPALPVLIAGDCNEDPFEIDRDYPVALDTSSDGSILPVVTILPPEDELSKAGNFALYSGWTTVTQKGSYNYAGNWERIDHFFWNRQLADGTGWEVREFMVLDDPMLLNDEGVPLPYDGRSMSGYSDHLPLMLILERR